MTDRSTVAWSLTVDNFNWKYWVSCSTIGGSFFCWFLTAAYTIAVMLVATGNSMLRYKYPTMTMEMSNVTR